MAAGPSGEISVEHDSELGLHELDCASQHARALHRRCELHDRDLVEAGTRQLGDVAQRNQSGRMIPERRVEAGMHERKPAVETRQPASAEREFVCRPVHEIRAAEHHAERSGSKGAVQIDLESPISLEARAFRESCVETTPRFDEPPAESDVGEKIDDAIEVPPGDEEIDVAERSQRRVVIHRVREKWALEDAVLDFGAVEQTAGVNRAGARAEDPARADPRGDRRGRRVGFR